MYDELTKERENSPPGCSTESLNNHVPAMAEIAKAGGSAEERKNHRPTKK
jgi:hypothetical protein